MSGQQCFEQQAAGKVIQRAAMRIAGASSVPKVEVAVKVVSDHLGVTGSRSCLARAAISAGLVAKRHSKIMDAFQDPATIETHQPTREEIERSVDFCGRGATRLLLASWGVPWPPPKGWKKELLRKADEAAGIPSRKKRDVRPERGVSPKPRSFYASREWKTLRFRALERFGRMCMCCGWTPDHGGKNYLVVDHIKSRRLHPELELELSNLQVLCNECNLGKGSFSQADFRESGRQL